MTGLTLTRVGFITIDGDVYEHMRMIFISVLSQAKASINYLGLILHLRTPSPMVDSLKTLIYKLQPPQVLPLPHTYHLTRIQPGSPEVKISGPLTVAAIYVLTNGQI